MSVGFLQFQVQYHLDHSSVLIAVPDHKSLRFANMCVTICLLLNVKSIYSCHNESRCTVMMNKAEEFEMPSRI